MAAQEKSWSDLSADERGELRIANWLSPAGVEFASAAAEADYKARVTRLVDAVQLKKTPDRVPVLTKLGFYPGLRAGLTPYDAMTDTARAAEAWAAYTLDLQPDGLVSPLHNTIPAKAFELVDYRLYHWPGHGVDKDQGYQYNEDEFMLPEEYDLLIDDPSDFFWRVYLPRIAGAYKGFSLLSVPYDMVELPFSSLAMGPWGAPDMRESFEKLAAAGAEIGAWAGIVFPVIGRVIAAGFPDYWGYATKAPFDFIGDSMRGTRGIILDMFREPEKLLTACDRLAPLMVKWAKGHTTVNSPPGIFIPLHKGADGFMSDEQFHGFYWPSLRKVLLGLIEEGFIPWLFAEGRYGSRLEAIMDLPKGKTVWMFDQTDMARAKETIGQVACIQGNVPLSLMHAGTTDQIRDYCRNLIDTAGKGGGFILDVGAVLESTTDDALRAMIQTAKEYGVYA